MEPLAGQPSSGLGSLAQQARQKHIKSARSILFAIGVLTIREGANRNNFGVLNYGLLIIAALVIGRFFDTNIGFVIKGILFVLVGLGFFFANVWMIRRKKKIVAEA